MSYRDGNYPGQLEASKDSYVSQAVEEERHLREEEGEFDKYELEEPRDILDERKIKIPSWAWFAK